MKVLTSSPWIRRLPIVLCTVALIGSLTGILSCSLATSDDTPDLHCTSPENYAAQTPSETLGPSGDLRPIFPVTFTPVATTYLPLVSRAGGTDKWALWTGPTQLRGANIYQRRVYPELDGPDFYGPGPVGPPYTNGR